MLKSFSQYDIFASDVFLSQCRKKNGDITFAPICEFGLLHDEFLSNNALFGRIGLSWRNPIEGDSVHGSVHCRLAIDSLRIPNFDREPKGKYIGSRLKNPITKYYFLIDTLV